ncbi:endonuclease domain-containing 1 protein-like [Sceloporus undulatus]|uniref:endonuclease domain-containing 1 protein-like n=1 Tax=Sceloporus undulatus TaxID=8520 RepID=UPI001C4C41C2|nr:endonuclease domain-containing 1 protein-like [Sceloporus undulatus]
MFHPFLPFLAACFLIPGKGEVVEDFKPCHEFFLDGVPPGDSLTPSNQARICQFYENAYRFATMYDSDKRIPIYSAYKCKPGNGSKIEKWMIEPQLVEPSLGKSMEDENTTQISRWQLKQSQAVSDDYRYLLNYTWGHLNPIEHQPDNNSRAATSTLTNMVPQFKKLSKHAWAKYENSIRDKAKQAHFCRDLYVIAGAVPSSDAYVSGNRVSKPSHIWSAACCVHEKKGRISWTAMARNVEDKVKEYPLNELQMELTKLYGKGKVDLFNSACNSKPAAHRRLFLV